MLKLILTMSAPDQGDSGTVMYRTLLWPAVPQLGTHFPAGANYDNIISSHEVLKVDHDFVSGCIWVALDGTLSEDSVERLTTKGWTRSSVLDTTKMIWSSERISPECY